MTSILDSPIISRTRRNHGLEHATIHLLSKTVKHRPLAGHSDSNGFWILGEVPTEEMASAVTEALARLQNGERHLAIHPNCGTNFATYGVAAGLAAFLGLAGANRFRDKLERLPLVTVLATGALILAQPLAFRLQEHVTTSGDPGDLQIVEIRKTTVGGRTAHRVVTRG